MHIVSFLVEGVFQASGGQTEIGDVLVVDIIVSPAGVTVHEHRGEIRSPDGLRAEKQKPSHGHRQCDHGGNDSFDPCSHLDTISLSFCFLFH